MLQHLSLHCESQLINRQENHHLVQQGNLAEHRHDVQAEDRQEGQPQGRQENHHLVPVENRAKHRHDVQAEDRHEDLLLSRLQGNPLDGHHSLDLQDGRQESHRSVPANTQVGNPLRFPLHDHLCALL